MTEILFAPYEIKEDQTYDGDHTIKISSSDFEGATYQAGKTPITFRNCRFDTLHIINEDEISFKDLVINFSYCSIGKIEIENITTKNLGISFGSSIIDGKIKSSNIQFVNLNNCLLNSNLFIIDVNRVSISYSDSNIYKEDWDKLLEGRGNKTEIIYNKTHRYNINDVSSFNFTITKTDSEGISFNGKTICKLNDDQINKFKIGLDLTFSSEKSHKLAKIVNATLSALSLRGYSNGEVIVENSQIDNIYIHDFSTRLGCNFYNISPFREDNERKFEIKQSNLDNVWFDNVSFNQFATITLYRNKFGNTKLTSCDFPDDYNGFDKFMTIANIHYPERKDKNYYKARYEIFLQLKKVFENSGNFYEAQKFQSVSFQALSKVEDVSLWDKSLLWLNKISNNHGRNYFIPFLITLCLSICFYVVYLFSIGKIYCSGVFDPNYIGYYFSFLDITHRSDFLVGKEELNGFSATIDYANKIIVGYWIYQFIAAFRKYGKI